MNTPLGNLKTLDLENAEIQKSILYYDKHQILEGLIAEQVVDQIIGKMLATQRQLGGMDVTSLIAAIRGGQRQHAFVLAFSEQSEEIQLYLQALARKYAVHLVRYDSRECDFRTHHGAYNGQTFASLDTLLSVELVTITGRTGENFPAIHEDVRSLLRQEQSYWGFLKSVYADNLAKCVLLPRIFKNFAVQPYFDFLWDIDRVLFGRVSRSFYVVEVKHKYPFFGNGELRFGVNAGAIRLLNDLAGIGFRCFHSIMVKPYWIDDRSVMYLFNDIEARKNVLFCGKLLSDVELRSILKSRRSSSPAKTSFTGQKLTDYYFFPASWLHRIGELDADSLAGNFARALHGELNIPISDNELRALKLSK